MLHIGRNGPLDNTQQAQQNSINPYLRVEVLIGGPAGTVPDRSLGLLIPEQEGVALYVERADYPVTLALVNQIGLYTQGQQARDGLILVNEGFKAISLTHPAIVSTVPLFLSLIICKYGSVAFNQLADPVMRMPFSTRIITNTAALQAQGIFIPVGMRRLRSMNVIVAGTTIVGAAAIALVNFAGNQVAAPNMAASVTAGGVLQAAYTGVPSVQQQIMLANGGTFVANFSEMVLPSWAAEIQVSVAGTVLTAMNVQGAFD